MPPLLYFSSFQLLQNTSKPWNKVEYSYRVADDWLREAITQRYSVKKCFQKLPKIHWKTPVPESLSSYSCRPQTDKLFAYEIRKSRWWLKHLRAEVSTLSSWMAIRFVKVDIQIFQTAMWYNVCHLISQDHEIRGLHNIMGGSFSC